MKNKDITKTEKKTVVISFKITPTEDKIFQKMVDEYGTSKSFTARTFFRETLNVRYASGYGKIKGKGIKLFASWRDLLDGIIQIKL